MKVIKDYFLVKVYSNNKVILYNYLIEFSRLFNLKYYLDQYILLYLIILIEFI